MRRISLFFPSLTNSLPSFTQHLIMYHSCILPFHFAPHSFSSYTLFVASKEFCLVFVFRSLSISLRPHTLFPVVLPKVRSLCSLFSTHCTLPHLRYALACFVVIACTQHTLFPVVLPKAHCIRQGTVLSRDLRSHSFQWFRERLGTSPTLHGQCLIL
jgi:hypothetical protein